MFKIGAVATVFAAVAAVAVLASATAWAAPAEWMLNGKTLSEDGLTTAALSTTGRLDDPSVIATSSLTLTCTGGEALVAPEIIKSNRGKASDLIATDCVVSPTTCAVPRTIGTVPVEVTLDGSSVVKGNIRPQSGTVFTTIDLTGAECAAAGNKSLTGDIEILAPEAQSEQTDQTVGHHSEGDRLTKAGYLVFVGVRICITVTHQQRVVELLISE